MTDFDPNDVAADKAGIFGLPFDRTSSALVLLPVPWDVTTSYGGGASRGPELILEASSQIDLFDLEVGRAYECGYFMEEIPQSLVELNQELRNKAIKVRELHGVAGDDDKANQLKQKWLEEINQGCEKLNQWVFTQSQKVLNGDQFLGIVGGDHASPLGAILALSEKFSGDFGILHVDAHADLRKSYEGFRYSHASIMYNAMTHPSAPKKLVQVGIRDFCEDEYQMIKTSGGRIQTFFDYDLKMRMMAGESWLAICDSIVQTLPDQVYISFDIDGLDPKLCPHTGTPVPGGLEFFQATSLIAALYRNKKTIVGFDLNEVSAGENSEDVDVWDGNVGARLLYKLCGWTMITNGRAKPLT